MRSFVVCYPQRVRESSEQKTPCSLAPGCFGQIGRPCFQDSAFCTNAAHIFGELQLIKQMPLMIIFYFSAHLLSLPSRGAWIEMRHQNRRPSPETVAPLTGSVDRNLKRIRDAEHKAAVAPLTGSVDRNFAAQSRKNTLAVAPLTGSVDRNQLLRPDVVPVGRSLPSRGAWIEIFW